MQNGRSRRDARHVRLYEWELKSQAYQSLHPYARALLIEFRRRFNGFNNGEISLSVREARKAIGCGRKAAERGLHELQDRGFIKLIKRGVFSVGTASEWALTNVELKNKSATKDYMSWTPNSPPRNQDEVPLGNIFGAPGEHKVKKKRNRNPLHRVPEGHGQARKAPKPRVPQEHTYSIPGGRQIFLREAVRERAPQSLRDRTAASLGSSIQEGQGALRIGSILEETLGRGFFRDIEGWLAMQKKVLEVASPKVDYSGFMAKGGRPGSPPPSHQDHGG